MMSDVQDIKDFASRVSNFNDERGSGLGPMFQLFNNLPLPTSLTEALAAVVAVPGLEASMHLNRLVEIANATAVDKTRYGSLSFVSPAEAAGLLLYSADSGFYPMLNNRLRGQDRQQLKPFVKIIWLLLHAMSKCPVPDKRHVYRGINCDLSADYPEGRVVTWNAFSSCTTRLEVLENEIFMGKFGPRTMFSLELTTNRGRVIASCSFHSNEGEVLLPPNTRFEVESTFRSGDGLVIVHMKELPPLDPILEFPGSGNSQLDELISLRQAVADKDTELASLKAELREARAASTTLSPTSVQTLAPSTAATPVVTTAATPPSMSFLADVTYPDGSNVQAGSVLKKTWRLRNSGQSAWPPRVYLTPHGETQTESVSLAISGSVQPGAGVEVSVMLTAPSSRGRHRFYYKLSTADGKAFGISIWAEINVESAASNVPPVPQPQVLASLPSMSFLADVTYPDGSNVQAGTFLAKTWRLRNNGQSAWPSGVYLAPHGEIQTHCASMAIDTYIQAGEATEISVLLTAPMQCGRHRLYYRMTTDDGKTFGYSVWAEFIVVATI